MKIAALFETDVVAGGGFVQACNAALQIKRICEGQYEFVVLTSNRSTYEKLASIGLTPIFFKWSFRDKILNSLSGHPSFARLQGRFKIVSPFENFLISQDIDLLYFLNPSSRAGLLQKTNFIATVWDLCHRDFPEFPEVNFHLEFERREQVYRSLLPKALLVIADSNELCDKLARYYGVNPQRILAIPFQPMNEVQKSQPNDDDSKILSAYRLRGEYLFYPAQFWAHKGHIRIFQALSIFRSRYGFAPQLALAGGDKGCLETVKGKISELRLENSVRFLGFVPSEHIPVLYRNALALVMPTYFGPTNIPPLEAMSIGIPVIYPSHLAEQCGEAATYFEADDPESLCDAIKKIYSADYRAKMVNLGFHQLEQIAVIRREAEKEFARKLRAYARRLECWKG